MLKTIINTFKTRLGNINLILGSSEYKEIKNSNNTKVIKTSDHLIEIISFDDIKDWVKDTSHPIEDSMGWLVRILKTSDNIEYIDIECSIVPKDKSVDAFPDSGEHLDAVWIENDVDVVNIKTEDGDMLELRARNNNWMPPRLKEDLKVLYSFTNYLDFGLKTDIPPLYKGEYIYFQYLVATDKKRKASCYSDEDDISTNLAVDIYKEKLIKRLKINDQKINNKDIEEPVRATPLC